MTRFDDAIEQMLWPEKRKKDRIFAAEDGPGVGVIDRMTADSWLDVAEGYVPDYLRPLISASHRILPFIGGTGGSLSIGPFPKGTPVGLITNMDLLGADLPDAERREHRRKLLALLKHLKSELKAGQPFAAVVEKLTDDMLAVSKCKDLVVNKGHYFGTSYFAEEPGLSDADKRALIAFLKTF